MILSASDLIICVTLVLNGGALLSGKMRNQLAPLQGALVAGQEHDDETRELLDDQDDAASPTLAYSTSAKPLASVVLDSNGPLAQRALHAVQVIRRYSFLLIVWNAVFLCLMIFVFRE
jgi:hypothetical protein